MVLPDYRWQRIGLNLRCTFVHPGRKAHALSVFEAIVKGIGEAEGLLPPAVRTVFRWPGVRCTQMHIHSGTVIPLEILLFGADDEAARRWYARSCTWFDPGGPGRNFCIEGSDAPVGENWSELLASQPARAETDESALDFFTPLAFTPSQGRSRTWLDGAILVRAMQDRLRRLFGAEAELPPAPDVLPAYWNYCQIEHAARSQQGHTKYLNGCVGPLLLRGPHLAVWWPWLVLFDRIGIGAQISFGQGICRLHFRSRPILDAALTDPNQIRGLLEQLAERGDELLQRLSRTPHEPDLHALSLQIASGLRDGRPPEAFQASQIPRPDGRSRRIEIPQPQDMIVLQHLARLLAEPFDRLFSVHSIGYRKGHSREDAIELIRAAIAEGCTHVLESDISDFFPSVDLARLTERLEQVLPRRDQRLYQTLFAYLAAPWRLGEQPVQARRCGLPQGSPLSPLLANLYLDSFDNRLGARTPGVRLIRYADDFVILAESEEAARQLLDEAHAAATELGLTLNADKTAIRPLSEGFTFLGIRFSADAAAEQAGDEIAEAQAKVLYITEPYAFVGANHDAIDVSVGGKPLGRFPLARTSGIVTLAPCTLSSALIARLADQGIPIAIAGSQGRQIATLAGDTAKRFAIAARQAQKYERLGEAGRCRAAGEFASAKLTNYIALIRQRGLAGTAALASHLEEGIAAIARAAEPEVIRGIEGECARACFPFIAAWIRSPDFPWQGRRRHGECPDRLNSLLNLGYHLLFTRINALLRVTGLNPYLGFLHEANGRYEALACDIQEVFRSYVDRLIVRLINLKVIEATDFEESESGWWLTRPARARFLQQFAREIERRPMRRRYSLGECIEGQVRAVQDWLIEDRPLIVHRWTNDND